MAEAAAKVGTFPAWVYKIAALRSFIVPVSFIALVGVLLIPLPPAMLDVLISLNFALAVIILLTTIYMEKPLDFSVFPSLLLATTLYRLVLNVASTRLILSANAGSAEEALGIAGHVILAFGKFVAGDSMFVGIVIFLILIIVQFIVITKGATRISEVAARFTLDAMPGKQMAIDADLNAGTIDEKEARRRREAISQEADFFGAMDGASKFVRGDAIAGIVITVINIAGGFALGMVDRGWDAAQTAKTFTLLTIGDGLTAQIPALIISIASALIVTRSGSKEQLGTEFTDQLASQPKGLYITAAFLGLLSLTPLPTVPLLATGAILAAVAYGTSRSRANVLREAKELADAPKPQDAAPIEQLMKVDLLELEVGVGLIALVDVAQGGELLDRISATRRQLALEMGVVMPPVRIRDNMQIPTTDYRIKIRGNSVAAGSLRINKVLAMDPGVVSGTVQGEATREPAFGLPAWWIEPALRTRAETLNFTVVDPTSVLVTHIAETVKRHAEELLTRDEVNNLVEGVKVKSPKLVEETIPAIVKPLELQKVLQGLLRERVSIRDMETILDTLAEWGSKTKDPEVLVEYVRNSLRRAICNQYAVPDPSGDTRPRLVCVTLDPALEDEINAYIDRGAAGTSLTMPARVAKRYAEHLARSVQLVTNSGYQPIVIASPAVRAIVRQLLEPHVKGIVVLGYNEITAEVDVQSLALVAPPPAEGVQRTGLVESAA